MRVATWNLDRPRARQSARIECITRQIQEVDADVWLLTETSHLVVPGDRCASIIAEPTGTDRSEPQEARSAIWSLYPIVRVIETHDPKTAVCAIIRIPIGPLTAYATIIPYGFAGGNVQYSHSGQIIEGAKPWQLHLLSIDWIHQDLRRISSAFPGVPIVLGGDFNQSRDDRKWRGRSWYGTKKGRDRLSSVLRTFELTCLTDCDFAAKGQWVTRSSVDHLCVSNTLLRSALRVAAWESPHLDRTALSDHNGVHFDVTLPTTNGAP
jgi:hypothetical protein